MDRYTKAWERQVVQVMLTDPEWYLMRLDRFDLTLQPKSPPESPRARRLLTTFTEFFEF